MSTIEERRDLWLEKLADHVLAHGLNAASLRPLAKAAGTSDRMLLYYFTDKADLIAAILQKIAARLTLLMLDHGYLEPLPYDPLLRRIAATLSGDSFAPYLRLFLQIASGAAQGDALCRQNGALLGRAYLEWTKAQLISADETSRMREAAMIMQRIEGMVFLSAIGLDDVNAAAFDTEATIKP
jgi:AcrR family transcriptional regulator